MAKDDGGPPMTHNEALLEFCRRCFSFSWMGGDMFGDDVHDWGVELGLIQKVAYDPAIHGEEGLEYCEPGEDWYVLNEEIFGL